MRTAKTRVICLICFISIIAAFKVFLYPSKEKVTNATNDLTVVGFIRFADGLGRQPVWVIDCLKDVLRINWISTHDKALQPDPDLPKGVVETLLNASKTTGNVVLFTDPLWMPEKEPTANLPKDGLIKIASSMSEATNIPDKWVEILNTKFDAVVVPDEWLIEVYQKAGVKIPIFVLPLGLYLEEFLAEPPQIRPHRPFVFGNTCALDIRKNHMRLIEAFYKAFGNSPAVKLSINARFADPEITRDIKQFIESRRITNIEVRRKILSSKEYLEFMNAIDCFVTFSQGEGFSIPPREALALGIPVIISDNTAHKTISATGLVKTVRSDIKVRLPYSIFENSPGYGFDCSVDDAAAALQDAYKNYKYYYTKAQQGREWVRQYLKENLKQRYLTLIKPQKVVLGDKNEITNNYLITNSPTLYAKYLAL